MKIAYIVHDLNDPAVARRVRLLAAGGAEVAVAGFCRVATPPRLEGAASMTMLGLTADGRLAARVGAVSVNLLRPGGLRAAVAGAQVVIARSLEALALAQRVADARPLVYECLDIHRMMLGDGPASLGLRALERMWLKRTALLMVSSPAFLGGYFERRQGFKGASLLVENRALSVEGGDPRANMASAPPAPPWRIGWFGVIRCARSLALLTQLAHAMDGRLEVLIAGRPARDQLPDFDAVIAASPHLEFVGPYAPADLPALYARTHFTWAIDYFEEGLNSAWLLPNRLYEGGLHGAVAIALADVETGRWLQKRGVGVVVTDPLADLPSRLGRLDSEMYAALRAAVLALPLGDLQASAADGRELVQRLAAL